MCPPATNRPTTVIVWHCEACKGVLHTHLQEDFRPGSETLTTTCFWCKNLQTILTLAKNEALP